MKEILCFAKYAVKRRQTFNQCFQMDKRYFGIENLATAISQLHDDVLPENNIDKFLNDKRIGKLFEDKYDINKNGKKKKAISLISKYFYFLRNYNFMIA